MDSIKEKIISLLLPVLVSMLVDVIKNAGPDKIKEILDKLFDFAEDAIAKSESTVDDKGILPIIEAIRVAFDIPDND